MIEGQIESVGRDGIVHGWVREAGQVSPCHVQVTHAGRVVAEATADAFRPDLLLAGHGHGHHGFRAHLRHMLPEGTRRLVLHLPRTGLNAPAALAVPKLAHPEPATVEELLRRQPGWTTSDLLDAPDCLDMPGNHAAMGSARFVDAVFRFVLDRWPSAAEAVHHARALDSRRISPTALLVEMLTSRERADLEPALPSPFAPGFPFIPDFRFART